jgi:hypothetical protein
MDDFDYMPSINPDDFKQGAGDEKLLAIFHMDIVKDETKTQENGRPIYRDEEFVRIFIPGDKSNVIDRPVRPSDKARFPKQYGAFKEGKDEDAQVSGTHLKDWPMVGRAQCAELNYFGIRTVEQLADVRDDVCAKIPGLTGLKQTAGVWLQKAQSTAEAAKIAAQLDEFRSTNEALQKSVEDLVSMNKALQDQLRGVLQAQAQAQTA